MPTSSQALILIKTDSGRLSTFYKTRICPNIPPLPLTKINFSGEAASRGSLAARSGVMVNSHHDPYQPSKPLEGLTVKGYRGVLSFDPALKSFRWQLLPDPTDMGNVKRPWDNQRTASAPDIDDHFKEKVVLTHLDESPSAEQTTSHKTDNNYRRLLDLGFKTSSFRGVDAPPSPETLESRATGHDFRRSVTSRPGSGRPKTPRQCFTSDRHMSAPSVAMSPHPPEKDTGLRHGQTDRRTTGRKVVIPSVASRYRSSWKPGSSSVSHQRLSSASRRYHISMSLPPIPETSRRYSRSRSRRTMLERSDKLQDPGRSSSHAKVASGEAQKVNKRKKTKLPAIRMRRELPPPSPHALCFSLKNNRSFTHQEIKTIIEDQIYASIGTLLFDPVYMHLGVENTEGKCLWVFTLEDQALRILLINQGLQFEDERVRVRRYDDVLYDEHQAYRLFRSVADEQQRRQLIPSQRRSSLQKAIGGAISLDRHIFT